MYDSALPSAILFFGNDWSAENRTSSHHIARWLSRRYPVYYIECPGLRAPQSTRRDLFKIVKKVVRFVRGSRQVESNLHVSTLLQVPLHRFALVRKLNACILRWSLRWLLWRNRIHDPTSWFMIPHLASVIHQVGDRRAVYYCTDDYASFPGVNPQAVRALDEQCASRADLVFVTSETLLPDKQRLNSRSFVSPHGVDLKHFGQARGPASKVSATIAHLPRPIVGFFGLIERWIDLDLVNWLAQQRPNWTFLMIGRVAVPPAELPCRPNIHFLGKRPYDELPLYGKHFDAAIIPYRPTRQVYHANPIKLREYLAMGKPIVSVSTPEIDKYGDVVEIARSREVFLTRLDDVLSRPDGGALQRLARVSAEGWETRLEKVLERVETLSPQTRNGRVNS